METVIIDELIKAYGLPLAAAAYIVIYYFRNPGSSPSQSAPPDIHAQLQFIRDKLVAIEAKIDMKK